MFYTLRQLQHLVAVADAGRISAAAKTLHISQPALSASLLQLESACGSALFVRHKARGVSLTDSGRKLVVEARKLVNHALELENYARHLGDGMDGEMAVGCFTTLAPLWLPRLLSALRLTYPALSINVQEGDVRELQDAILDGRIETALSYDIDIPEALDAVPLARMQTYALLHSGHELAKRKRISLKQLREDPMVLLDLPHSRDYFRSVFSAAGIEPRVVYRTSSFEMVRCMVANGHGYSVLNQRIAMSKVYDGGEVAMVPLTDNLPELNVVLLTLSATPLTRRGQTFVDFCRDFYA
ncbi:MAG: LysR family transcriptional regulator [Pseudomonadota bacterium]